MILENNEETWEMIELASDIYTVGDPLPVVDFSFYINQVSDRNIYCSNEGISKQIKDTLEINPNRQKIVYFYYKLNK